MKNYQLSQLSALAFTSKKPLIFTTFFFLVGISAGGFFEVAMDDGSKLQVAQFLQQYLYLSENISQGMSYPNPFSSSTFANLFLLFIIGISGLSAIGFPIAYAVLVYKGLALGFSSGLLLETLKFKGIGVILVSMIPQNILLIPAFILAVCVAQNYAAERIRQNSLNSVRTKKNFASMRNSYILINILIAAIIVAGCLIEGLLFAVLT